MFKRTSAVVVALLLASDSNTASAVQLQAKAVNEYFLSEEYLQTSHSQMEEADDNSENEMVQLAKSRKHHHHKSNGFGVRAQVGHKSHTKRDEMTAKQAQADQAQMSLPLFLAWEAYGKDLEELKSDRADVHRISVEMKNTQHELSLETNSKQADEKKQDLEDLSEALHAATKALRENEADLEKDSEGILSAAARQECDVDSFLGVFDLMGKYITDIRDAGLINVKAKMAKKKEKTALGKDQQQDLIDKSALNIRVASILHQAAGKQLTKLSDLERNAADTAVELDAKFPDWTNKKHLEENKKLLQTAKFNARQAFKEASEAAGEAQEAVEGTKGIEKIKKEFEYNTAQLEADKAKRDYIATADALTDFKDEVKKREAAKVEGDAEVEAAEKQDKADETKAEDEEQAKLRAKKAAREAKEAEIKKKAQADLDAVDAESKQKKTDASLKKVKKSSKKESKKTTATKPAPEAKDEAAAASDSGAEEATASDMLARAPKDSDLKGKIESTKKSIKAHKSKLENLESERDTLKSKRSSDAGAAQEGDDDFDGTHVKSTHHTLKHAKEAHSGLDTSKAKPSQKKLKEHKKLEKVAAKKSEEAEEEEDEAAEAEAEEQQDQEEQEQAEEEQDAEAKAEAPAKPAPKKKHHKKTVVEQTKSAPAAKVSSADDELTRKLEEKSQQYEELKKEYETLKGQMSKAKATEDTPAEKVKELPKEHHKSMKEGAQDADTVGDEEGQQGDPADAAVEAEKEKALKDAEEAKQKEAEKKEKKEAAKKAKEEAEKDKADKEKATKEAKETAKKDKEDAEKKAKEDKELKKQEAEDKKKADEQKQASKEAAKKAKAEDKKQQEEAEKKEAEEKKVKDETAAKLKAANDESAAAKHAADVAPAKPAPAAPVKEDKKKPAEAPKASEGAEKKAADKPKAVAQVDNRVSADMFAQKASAPVESTLIQLQSEEYPQPDIRGPMPQNAHPDSTFSSHVHNDWTYLQQQASLGDYPSPTQRGEVMQAAQAYEGEYIEDKRLFSFEEPGDY